MGGTVKVVIIGAGAVGSTFAYTLQLSGLAREIVLIDIDKKQAEGNAMDLNHGLFFTPPVKIRAGSYTDCAGADIVVITAGAKQKPGETRLDLVQRNIVISNDIVSHITQHTRDAILLMVTNPVDILTYAAIKQSGFPKNKILGSGTVLDSARFRYLLSKHCEVSPHNVHAYILGEHGDSEVAAWSITNIAGIPIEKYCKYCRKNCSKFDRKEIVEQVRNSAYHVIEAKGATYYAVSLAMEKIVRSILRDENSVLTVSTFVDNFAGINDVCLSLPVIVNRNGVDNVIFPELSKSERAELRASEKVLKDILKKVDLQ